MDGYKCEDRLLSAIQSADLIVAHNAKFELQWLKRLGLKLEDLPPVYDTMLGEYVLAGNRNWELGLDPTALRYGLEGKKSFISSLMEMGLCPSEMPKKMLMEYGEQDCITCHDIFLRQRILLQRAGLLPVFMCRNLLVPVLADIEFNGMQLDYERVTEQFNETTHQFSVAELSLQDIAGDLNFRSPKQISRHLYATLGFGELKARGKPIRSPAGNPKTDSDTIRRLNATSDAQRAFRSAFVRLNDLRITHDVIKKLKGCVDEDKGELYARFNQTFTQTHRFSSTGGKWKVQFQNFPREFKGLFKARHSGWKVVEADAPQLEFRCAVDVSNDSVGMSDILNGVDVHALTQAVIGCDRTSAKPFTFKPLYGGDSGTPKERAYYKAFREKYSDTFDCQTQWTYEVLEHKNLRIPSGLIFYWPDTTIDSKGYIKNKASIFNYPIQSFATADIIPLVLWLVWTEIKARKLKTFIISTIHDSIVGETPPEEEEQYKDILKWAFTEEIYNVLKSLFNYDFKVPLGVGIKSSTNWGEGKEEKYESKSRFSAHRDSTILQGN